MGRISSDSDSWAGGHGQLVVERCWVRRCHTDPTSLWNLIFWIESFSNHDSNSAAAPFLSAVEAREAGQLGREDPLKLCTIHIWALYNNRTGLQFRSYEPARLAAFTLYYTALPYRIRHFCVYCVYALARVNRSCQGSWLGQSLNKCHWHRLLCVMCLHLVHPCLCRLESSWKLLQVVCHDGNNLVLRTTRFIADFYNRALLARPERSVYKRQHGKTCHNCTIVPYAWGHSEYVQYPVQMAPHCTALTILLDLNVHWHILLSVSQASHALIC